jgi:hypothetical protein
VKNVRNTNTKTARFITALVPTRFICADMMTAFRFVNVDRVLADCKNLRIPDLNSSAAYCLNFLLRLHDELGHVPSLLLICQSFHESSLRVLLGAAS